MNDFNLTGFSTLNYNHPGSIQSKSIILASMGGEMTPLTHRTEEVSDCFQSSASSARPIGDVVIYKFCVSCGYKFNNKKDKFCGACGKKRNMAEN